MGVPVQHGRQGGRRRLVQPAATPEIESDRTVNGLPVGAGGVRGYRHGDVYHIRGLVVHGLHVFLRDQPVQDRH